MKQDELASLIRKESDAWRAFIQSHADMVSKESLKIIQRVLRLGCGVFLFCMVKQNGTVAFASNSVLGAGQRMQENLSAGLWPRWAALAFRQEVSLCTFAHVFQQLGSCFKAHTHSGLQRTWRRPTRPVKHRHMIY